MSEERVAADPRIEAAAKVLYESWLDDAGPMALAAFKQPTRSWDALDPADRDEWLPDARRVLAAADSVDPLRAPVVGGEEPPKEIVDLIAAELCAINEAATDNSEHWYQLDIDDLSRRLADAVLAVIRDELELLARYRAQADRPGVVVDDHQVCDEQLREALRALAALFDDWGRPSTVATSVAVAEARSVLDRLGRGE